MSETKIQGIACSHSIITPICRANRGDGGAFDEAVERARRKYDEIVNGWAGEPIQPTIRLVLTVERPTEENSE